MEATVCWSLQQLLQFQEKDTCEHKDSTHDRENKRQIFTVRFSLQLKSHIEKENTDLIMTGISSWMVAGSTPATAVFSLPSSRHHGALDPHFSSAAAQSGS